MFDVWKVQFLSWRVSASVYAPLSEESMCRSIGDEGQKLVLGDCAWDCSVVLAISFLLALNDNEDDFAYPSCTNLDAGSTFKIGTKMTHLVFKKYRFSKVL